MAKTRSKKYRPRLVIEISSEQKELLNQYIAYGEQRRVFMVFVEDLTKMLEEFGHDFIMFMLARGYSYREAYLESRRLINSGSDDASKGSADGDDIDYS